MTLVDYCDREGLAHWPIYAHLHRLNPRHLSNILAKHTI
jgi:hypothetical protein